MRQFRLNPDKYQQFRERPLAGTPEMPGRNVAGIRRHPAPNVPPRTR